MGRQIPILMSPSDRQLLWDWLGQTDATAAAYYHPKGELVGLTGLADLGREPMVYLVRLADIDRVVLKHIATQGYWLIDQLNSPIIELSGGRAELGPREPSLS